MGSITINIYDKDQTLDSQECLERYFEILENIQGSIAEFERKEYADFNKDWEELIKYINEQKKKLKICYDRNLLEIHLNSDADISGFYRKCNANPKCLNYISPQDKKLTELKDDTETSCEGRNCGKKVKAAKGKTGVKTPQLNEKGSLMKTLETQKSQGQGENHVDGKEPKQEQVISQDHPHVISLRPSVEPKSDGSEPKLDHHSNPHIPIDNPTQRLGIAPQPTHRALDSNPSDSSLQNSSEGDSPSIGTSQGKTPETVASQRDTRNSQTLNDNAHGKQAVGSQTYEEHTSVDKDAVVASATENRDVGTSISGNPGHRNPPPIVTDGAVDGSISLPSVGATGIRGTTELSGHAIYSVECTTGSALPGEVDTTKAAGNSPTDSKAADEFWVLKLNRIRSHVVKILVTMTLIRYFLLEHLAVRLFQIVRKYRVIEILLLVYLILRNYRWTILHKVNRTLNKKHLIKEMNYKKKRHEQIENPIKKFTQVRNIVQTCNNHKLREVMKAQQKVYIM
ncbi:VIR protein [Plasmodium vivax]|uniref:VIR protein n=1 Tax=Plasmodium vivax TaxID=5855 RepID=A0A1G4E9P4_PLAVI|nr:VIR protein [Plasmodium vivax]